MLIIGLKLPPDYVLDKMQWYEAYAYYEYGYLTDKNTWEQTRWLGNLYINAHSKSRVDLEDTIKFPWDTEKKAMTQEDVEAERQAAQKEVEHVRNLLKKGKLTTVARLK